MKIIGKKYRHISTKKFVLIYAIVIFLCDGAIGQDSGLLSLLEEEETVDYTTASFKTNRIINLHSIENTAKGTLDFKISHRFGFLNSGIDDLFGLDQSSIRIGFEYGLFDRVMVGLGRSSFEKTYDGFLKLKVLRQSSGKSSMPIAISYFGSTAIKTTPFQNPDRDNYFSSRLYYTHQLLIARKFSESFSLQMSPGVVHRNLIKTNSEKNDVLHLGIGGRLKISKRTSINSEYIYVLPDQLAPGFRSSFSIGFDIETGGHVFQLHFSNSTSMIEKGFITETTGDFLNGDIHFGFNVSRVFSVN